MAGKIATIKLSGPYGHAVGPAKYRVEQITDSVEYAPGAMLELGTVRQLCESRQWKVTIVPVRA